MSLGLGAGTEIRTPMAIAVIGGVLVSTALSLYVVPSFYVKLEGWLSAVRRSIGRAEKEPGPVAGDAAERL